MPDFINDKMYNFKKTYRWYSIFGQPLKNKKNVVKKLSELEKKLFASFDPDQEPIISRGVAYFKSGPIFDGLVCYKKKW